MTENNLNKSYYSVGEGEGEERILRGQIDTVLVTNPDYSCRRKEPSFKVLSSGFAITKGFLS